MKIGVNAIATLINVNEKGEYTLDVQGAKNLGIGTLILGQSEKLPGENDRI